MINDPRATAVQPRPPTPPPAPKVVELNLNPPVQSDVEMLEEILESLKVIDANMQKVLTHLEELEAWAEKVDEQLDELEFKSDYPRLDEES